MTWEIYVAPDGRLVSDLEPRIASDRRVTVAEVPQEGDSAFDALVDTMMAGFHWPEAYATNVVRALLVNLERGADERG